MLLRDGFFNRLQICPWELNKTVSPNLCVVVVKVSSTGGSLNVFNFLPGTHSFEDFQLSAEHTGNT